jgi:catechol 2,3-dioxygenase-like lactoylglutathione lyase family enzyme
MVASDERAVQRAPMPGGVVAAVALLAAVGFALRVHRFGAAWSPDELANLYGGPAYRALWDPEVAVNPPLLRFVCNALGSDAWAPRIGRALSIVAGVAVIPASARLAWRVGAGPLGAAVVAALWALHPGAIEASCQFRAYALFCAALHLHVGALLDVVEGRGGRRRLVASAVILPWLHYFAVPMMLGLAAALSGLGRRTDGSTDRAWLARAYVPAALGVAPLAPIVIGEDATRVAAPGSWVDTFTPILSMGWELPQRLLPWISSASGDAWSGPGIADRGAMALVSLTLVVGLVRWRRADTARRVLFAVAMSVVASTALLGLVQFPRSPVGLLLMTAWLPWALSAAEGWRGRWVAQALFAAWVLDGPPGHPLDALRPDEGLGVFARTWRTWDEVRGARTIEVAPGYGLIGMYFYLEERHLMAAPDEPACAGSRRCFVHDGVRFRAAPPGPASGFLVVFEEEPPAGLDRCRVLAREAGLLVADCPDAAGEAPRAPAPEAGGG